MKVPAATEFPRFEADRFMMEVPNLRFRNDGGFWAFGTLPEHIVGLLFFLLAMLFAVAPPHVVFSGFASGTLWLVLAGLIIAEAVNRTGLVVRIARFLIGHRALTYRGLIAVTVLVPRSAWSRRLDAGRVHADVVPDGRREAEDAVTARFHREHRRERPRRSLTSCRRRTRLGRSGRLSCPR